VKREAELTHIVDALGTPGGFTGGLDSRQQQGHQDADDGDHHQQLNERKTVRLAFRTPPTVVLDRLNL
jgi:hypothetical protein